MVSDAADLVLPNTLTKDGTSKRKGFLGHFSKRLTNHFFADQMALLKRLSPKAKARPQFDAARLILFVPQPCAS